MLVGIPPDRYTLLKNRTRNYESFQKNTKMEPSIEIEAEEVPSYATDEHEYSDEIAGLRGSFFDCSRRWVIAIGAIGLLVGASAVAIAVPISARKGGGDVQLVQLAQQEERFIGASSSTLQVFSTLDPVRDLGLMDFNRPDASKPPSTLTNGVSSGKSYPTNSWYQNMLLTKGSKPEATHRAYAIPYVVDAVGPVPGVRVHPSHSSSSNTEVHMNVVESFGLTLGSVQTVGDSVADDDYIYHIQKTTPLGLTLEWVSHVPLTGETSMLTCAPNPLLFTEKAPNVIVRCTRHALCDYDVQLLDRRNWVVPHHCFTDRLGGSSDCGRRHHCYGV